MCFVDISVVLDIWICLVFVLIICFLKDKELLKVNIWLLFFYLGFYVWGGGVDF